MSGQEEKPRGRPVGYVLTEEALLTAGVEKLHHVHPAQVKAMAAELAKAIDELVVLALLGGSDFASRSPCPFQRGGRARHESFGEAGNEGHFLMQSPKAYRQDGTPLRVVILPPRPAALTNPPVA